MTPQMLTENISEIVANAVQKIPRKWANVQAISIKTPESVALPVYSKLPSLMDEIDQQMNIEVEEQQMSGRNMQQSPACKVDADQNKKLKSPLLEALKKVENEKKKKRKEPSDSSATPKSTPEKKKKKEVGSTADSSGGQKDFIPAKKYQGSKSGYVFRMDKNGLGYYKDIKPVVDRLAMEAIKRLGKGSGTKGRRNRRSF